MAILDVHRIPQVSVSFMNDDHGEEARLLNLLGEAVAALRVAAGSPHAVLERFAALDAHTRDHFGREEDVMQRTHFPPFPLHKAEHDLVLAEMAEERRRFRERGDSDRLWAYVSQAVPSWFVGHIQTMDLVTARFVAHQP